MLKRVAGAVVAALACLAALVALAEARWRSDTSRLVQRSRRRAAAPPSRRFAASELDALPEPVVRYFRSALSEGQRMVRSARLEQRGEFLLRSERNDWRPFTATEHFGARPAGFVWDARIRMAPGIYARVRDGFVEGRGFMRASLLGLLTLISVEGTPEIAEAALQRYLAEAAWLPTALIPSQGVVWTPLDRSSARATLAAGGKTASIDFRFGADGLIETVFTPARARFVDGRAVPTPWQGRFSEYAERGGMRIPLVGEVEWLLPEGPQAYWKGRVVDAVYEWTAD